MDWRCRCSRHWAAIPYVGDLYVFRGVRGDLIKIVWHDGIGLSLYAKRLERGRFWFEALPEPLRETATGEALQAIVEFDLSELAELDPPRGFGRD